MSDSFEWVDFFKLATQLRTKEDPSEAELRTAIGRAYYAAYHCAREAKPDLVERVSGSAHAALWNKIRGLRGRNERLGMQGRRLMEARQMADYDRPFGIRKSAVLDAAGIARKAEEVESVAKMLIEAFSGTGTLE